MIVSSVTVSLISFFRLLFAVFTLWVANAGSVVTVMSLVLMMCDAVCYCHVINLESTWGFVQDVLFFDWVVAIVYCTVVS